jgi:hypothetical protein
MKRLYRSVLVRIVLVVLANGWVIDDASSRSKTGGTS